MHAAPVQGPTPGDARCAVWIHALGSPDVAIAPWAAFGTHGSFSEARGRRNRSAKARSSALLGTLQPHWSDGAPLSHSAVHQCLVSSLQAEGKTDVPSSFRQAWAKRVTARFGSVRAHFLSREHLVSEKQYYDRPQDRADVAVLLARPSPKVERRRWEKENDAVPSGRGVT